MGWLSRGRGSLAFPLPPVGDASRDLLVGGIMLAVAVLVFVIFVFLGWTPVLTGGR